VIHLFLAPRFPTLNFLNDLCTKVVDDASKLAQAAPPSPYRYTVHALIGAVFVAAWSGAVLGAGLDRLSEAELNTDSTTASTSSFEFSDRYTLRTGRPYFAGYDFLEKADAQIIAAWQKTTVKSKFSADETLYWTLTHPNGTSEDYTTTDTDSLTFQFSEAGTGSVSVSSGKDTDTVSFFPTPKSCFFFAQL